jgi:hypothetical protein
LPKEPGDGRVLAAAPRRRLALTKRHRALRLGAVLVVSGTIAASSGGCQLDFNDPTTRGLIFMIGAMFSPDSPAKYPYAKVERKFAGGVEYVKRTRKDGTIEYGQVTQNGDEKPMPASQVASIFPGSKGTATTSAAGDLFKTLDKASQGTGIFSTSDDSAWMGGKSKGQQGSNHGGGGGGGSGGGSGGKSH